MNDRAAKPGDLVCVTGAAGYVGSHIVRELLSRGYRVRGTVRDAADEDGTAHLRTLARDAAHPLELVSADLTVAHAFDAALTDVPFVIHTASSVRLTSADPQKDIVDVAVNGTKNVFASIAKAACAKAVVLTSSIAAVIDDDLPIDHTFTENDWNQSATLAESPYPLSKTLAEKAARTCAKSDTGTLDYRLVAINPTLVLGPVYRKQHVRSSPAVLRDLLTGKFPFIPDFRFGVADVREVASAHVEALERADADGRHIISAAGVSMKVMAATLRDAYPERKIPKYGMPTLGMYAFALFDKRMNWGFLRRNLGITRKIDNARSQSRLGIEYRPVAETLLDTARSMIDLGLA